MHYFQFHIGDYRAATAHLSNEEDLAYRRLLDMYYDTEQNIPLDTQWVSRRLRVKKDVVQAVLEDFFVCTESGWAHEKCEEVIAHYHENVNKNRQNGRLGGRPKKTQSVSSGNPVVTQHEPTQKATNNQETSKPVNQETEKREEKRVRSAPATQFPDGFVLTEQLIKYAQLKHVDYNIEFESFRNWTMANGKTYKNWDAAWRSWVDKAAKFRQSSMPRQQQLTPYQQSIKSAGLSIVGNLENFNEHRTIDVTPEKTAGLLGSQDF